MIYHSEKAITYGKKLRKLRLEAGLTQTQLAFDLGIAAQYVSKFETGARYPWRTARVKINNYFEVMLYADCKQDRQLENSGRKIKEARRV